MNLSFESASILMKAEDACCRSNSKKSVKEDDKIYAKAKAIENYVRLHYNQSFGSSDIERDLLINFDYSNRIFKKIYGYSIIKYRNMLRINTAKTLICSMPLNEIASVTGFNDIYYFSKCFKKFTGVSPSKYITPIENAADISKG